MSHVSQVCLAVYVYCHVCIINVALAQCLFDEVLLAGAERSGEEDLEAHKQVSTCCSRWLANQRHTFPHHCLLIARAAEEEGRGI